jgi:hypothetical protein
LSTQGGGFRYEEQTFRPDLALIAKDFTHWFIVEAELVTHSLHGHVLPQIRAFRYGEPQTDSISVLVRATGLTEGQIRTFLRAVPRSVAVIANRRSREWEIALESHQVQMLTVMAFTSSAGIKAIEPLLLPTDMGRAGCLRFSVCWPIQSGSHWSSQDQITFECRSKIRSFGNCRQRLNGCAGVRITDM